MYALLAVVHLHTMSTVAFLCRKSNKTLYSSVYNKHAIHMHIILHKHSFMQNMTIIFVVVHAYIRSTYWFEMSMNVCALESAVGVGALERAEQ